MPTASSSKGLGTGEFDYSIGAELSKTVGNVTPFAGIAHTFVGDPEKFDLRNSFSARAGLAAQLGTRVRGYVAYCYARSISPLLEDEQQISTGMNAGLSEHLLSTGMNAGLSEHLSLGLYGSAGLSDGSPNFGAGVQIGLGLF